MDGWKVETNQVSPSDRRVLLRHQGEGSSGEELRTDPPSPPLTPGSRIVGSSSADELLSSPAQGREAGQQLVELQALSPVLRQLLSDLLHLRRHWGGLPQTLDRPLQGLQQGVHFVVELAEEREM